MKRRSVIPFLASLAAATIGWWLSPFSTAFIFAAVGCGVLYVVLRFCLWTPKAERLPMLAYGLAVIVGMRFAVSTLFPEVRTGSASDWSLGLLFLGMVGAVVFAYRLFYLSRKARRSI